MVSISKNLFVCLSIISLCLAWRNGTGGPCHCLTPSVRVTNVMMSRCHLRSVRCHPECRITDINISNNLRGQRVHGKVNKSGVILDRKSRVMRDHKGCSDEYSSPPLNFPPLQSAVTRTNSLIPPPSRHYARQTFCVLCVRVKPADLLRHYIHSSIEYLFSCLGWAALFK